MLGASANQAPMQRRQQGRRPVVEVLPAKLGGDEREAGAQIRPSAVRRASGARVTEGTGRWPQLAGRPRQLVAGGAELKRGARVRVVPQERSLQRWCVHV